MDLIKLNIVGYSHSEFQHGAFALILSEENGNRNLSIVIGACEAQSIAIGLEPIKIQRPLTHDLFKTFAKKFNINLLYIYIHKISSGIFHSYLIFKTKDEKKEKIDARTSDAVAIAIRFKVPIYTNDKILKEANSEKYSNTKEKEKKIFKESSSKLEALKSKSKKDIKNLETQLQQALLLENYESAAEIRDLINKLKKKEIICLNLNP